MNFKFLFASAIAFILLSPLYSQEYTGESASQLIPNSTLIKVDSSTQKIEYFELEEPQRFFKKNKTAINGKSLAVLLKMPASFAFEEIKTFTDEIGISHTKYQQTYNQIPVEHMVYTVHAATDKVSANGNYCSKPPTQYLQKTIPFAEALETSLTTIPSQFYSESTTNQKENLVYVLDQNTPVLCYKIDVHSYEPLQREYIYVDAYSGQIIARENRIHHVDAQGEAETMYHGKKEITTEKVGNYYRLQETGRGKGIRTFDLNNGTNYSSAIDFTDSNNYWDEISNLDNAAYDVHYGTEMTYDYFKRYFNRNSIDNNGMVLSSYVHYNSSYPNAFWNGEVMTYGDGDGSVYTPFTCVEIVAHEITHGLTAHTAELVYQNESGALNESFSDIFGTVIDFYANPEQANYLIGEHVRTNHSPLREMKQPKNQQNPDTYKGLYWHTATTDNGGVHTNSAVQNYWFYLLCEGGSNTNDHGNFYHVSPISMENAAAIAYRNLTVYLTPNSDYSDARYYSIKAATDLFGACSNEVISVTNAWHAVGVGEKFEHAVTAEFQLDLIENCDTPTFAYPINTSSFAESHTWYLNDKVVSTDENPAIKITEAGTHSISLVVKGSIGCRTSDSISRKNIVHIYNNPALKDPHTRPYSYNKKEGGITQFLLGDFEHTSNGAEAGYEDFSCSKQLTLREGKFYPFEIKLNKTPESVYIWIDLNNDGKFNDRTELVFQESSSNKLSFSGLIEIPKPLIYNTPLRLRIASEQEDYPLINGSTNTSTGQYEDYGIIITEHQTKPIANFELKEQPITLGDVVQFTNTSENLPTTFQWTFPGGIPSSSTEKNPKVLYPGKGVFGVSLIASNAYGSDTLEMDSVFNITDKHLMGKHKKSTSLQGKIFDSGGEDKVYSNLENHSFLIAPPCASKVVFTINEMNIDYYDDYLYIYDGDNTDGTRLATLTGSSVPSPNSFVASSGKLLLVFTSDESGTYNGFSGEWSSIPTNNDTVPKAAFSFPTKSPIPFNYPVHFTNTTKEPTTTQQWAVNKSIIDFGKDFIHRFTTSGSHEINLTVRSCAGTDSTTKTITVQEAPRLSFTKDSLFFEVAYGDTTSQFVTFSNTSQTGTLALAPTLTPSIKQNVSQKLLAIETYANTLPHSSFNKETSVFTTTLTDSLATLTGQREINVQLSIENDLTDMNIGILEDYYNYSVLTAQVMAQGGTIININNALFSMELLNTCDVLIIDDYNYLSTSNLHLLREWVLLGGKLIINSDSDRSDFNMLISGCGITYASSYCYAGNGQLWDHPITDGLRSYIISGSAQSSLNVTLPANKLITDATGRHYAAYAIHGEGQVFTTADESFSDYSINLTGHLDLIMNYLKFVHNDASILSTIQDEVWISPGSSDSIPVFVDAQKGLGGHYFSTLNIATNDTSQQRIQIPVFVHVTGIPQWVASKQQVNFGNVFTGHSAFDTIQLRNEGTDILEVSDIQSTNSALFLKPLQKQIESKETTDLVVAFIPKDINTYVDTITLTTNDPTKPLLKISITGKSVAPPVAQFSPDTVEQHLFTNDSIEREITIRNSLGGSPLYLDEPYVEILNSDAQTQVDLSNLKVCSYSRVSSYLENHMNAWGIEFIKVTSFNPQAFANADIILLDNYYTLSSSAIEFFKEFVQKGGGIMLDASTNPTNLLSVIEGSGLNYSTDKCIDGRNNTLYNSPLTRNMDEFYMIGANCSLLPNKERTIAIRDANSNIYCTADDLQAGRYVAFAGNCMYYSNQEGHEKLIYNSLVYLSKKMEWASISTQPPHTIAAGDSAFISLKLNAKNIGDNQITGRIHIPCNDPEKPTLYIPFTLNVSGISILKSNKTHIHFKQFVSGSAIDTLYINNPGVRELNVDSIWVQHPHYTASEAKLTIQPGQTTPVYITYTPDSVGKSSTRLLLHSDSKNGAIDTVWLSGEALKPPILEILPTEINVVTQKNKTTKKKLVLSNEKGASDLEYKLVFSECVSCNSGQGSNSLSEVLKALNNNYQKILAKIPNKYDFSHGITGFSIGDGGLDIYDSGNYLSTNLGSYISYSDNTISGSSHLGNESYFTRKYNGLFVFAADLKGVSSFKISGNLGNSSATVEGYTLKGSDGTNTYTGYVKKVYGESYTPSVNHLIVVDEGANATQEYSTSSYRDDHTIHQLENASRIYYLLFTGKDGYNYSQAQMQGILNEFIKNLSFEPGWLKVESSERSGTIAMGETQPIDISVSSNDLDYTTYSANILIYSNDPLNEKPVIPVNLNVVNNFPPNLVSSLSSVISYMGNAVPIDLSHHVEDPDNDPLTYTVHTDNAEILFPTIEQNHLLYLNPQKSGVTKIHLTARDYLTEPLEFSVDVLVKDNHRPHRKDTLEDVSMHISDNALAFNLTKYFGDVDEEELSFKVELSEDPSVKVTQSSNLLLLSPIKGGYTIVKVSAIDKGGAQTSQTFISYVLDNTNVASYKENKHFSVYPVPANQRLFIAARNGEKPEQLILYSVGGSTVMNLKNEWKATTNVIDISTLNSGVYILLWKSGKNVFKEKIIIQ